MKEAAASGHFSRNLLVRVAGYDLMQWITIGSIWTLVCELADLGVVLVLMLLRYAYSIVRLVQVFAPVRRCLAHAQAASDEELLEADAAIDRGRRQVTFNFVGGTTLALLLGTLLGVLGVPVPIELGPTELVTAVVLAVGSGATSGAVMHPILTGATDGARVVLRSAARDRGLELGRPRGSMVKTILVLQLVTTLGISVGLIGVCGFIRGRGLRAEQLADQQERALLDAAKLRRGDLELDPDSRVVSRDELPPVLQAPPQPDASLALLGAHALREGETFAAAPVGDGRWVLVRAVTDEGVRIYIVLALLLPVLAIGPLVSATLSSTRVATNNLRELRRATRRVVEEGKIHGIERALPLRDDEVGMLVRDFNGMLDVLAELAEAAERVAKGDLRVQFERPGELHDAFRSMVSQLDAMVVEIREMAVELGLAAGQLEGVVAVQEGAARRQSESSREVSATATSLANSARDIADTAAQVLDNADRTLATTDTVGAKLGQLRREAEGVGELLERIREVADRSDLLALNGSLEATRAGEAGRGFALVAAEMRRLAERVSGTVADVRERVTSIDAASAGTTEATQQSRELAERTASATREITALTSKQSSETEQVSRAIDEVSHSASETASASAQTRSAARQLSEQAGRLEQLTGRFKLRERG